MRIVLKILSILLTLMPLGGCVTESGDIGFFYGVWALRSMDIDDAPADIDCSRYFWKFQGGVIFITVTDEFHQYDSTIGSWKVEGYTLELNFTYHNATEGSEDSPTYSPPEALCIPGKQVTPMTVVSLSASDMTLRYVTADGKTIVYKLHKMA